MILTYLAYLLTFASAFYFGKKLYGSWVAAVFLALFSGPLLAVANFVVGLCLLPLIAILPLKIASDNEWLKGFSLLISAGLVTAILRYYAKTEGKTSAVEHKKPDSNPSPPSSYDSAWK